MIVIGCAFHDHRSAHDQRDALQYLMAKQSQSSVATLDCWDGLDRLNILNLVNLYTDEADHSKASGEWGFKLEREWTTVGQHTSSIAA